MRMTNALDTGGGRHEEIYEKRGLRDSGTGICRGSTFAMTGCAGGEGEVRGVAKYSGVQQLGEVPVPPHTPPTNANTCAVRGSVSNPIQRHRPGPEIS